MTAGNMTRRFRFQPRSGQKDRFGAMKTDFGDGIGPVWAHMRYLRGGEAVIASRLEGKQPAVVTVRASSQTRQITPEWRMLDEDGTPFAIRAIVPTQDRALLEITVEGGVAE